MENLEGLTLERREYPTWISHKIAALNIPREYRMWISHNIARIENIINGNAHLRLHDVIAPVFRIEHWAAECATTIKAKLYGGRVG